MKEIYKAKDGMTFKRVSDGVIMGEVIHLGKCADGSDDVISNYIEVEKHKIVNEKKKVKLRKRSNLQ